jgi:hypothetical protein
LAYEDIKPLEKPIVSTKEERNKEMIKSKTLSVDFNSCGGLEEIRNRIQDMKKEKKDNFHRGDNFDFEVSREALTKYKKGKKSFSV